MSAFSFDYTIDVDADKAVVYVKIFGMWKAETARAYHEEFKSSSLELINRPWAKVVDLSNWKTSYDEVTGIIGKHMIWSQENNCQMSLYVLNNTSTFRQLNEMFRKGRTQEVSNTFRTFAEAVAYLKANWLPEVKTP
ncbi:MAG: hypothetical protein SGI97_08575 [candidate division Zixibacteria bacterium]|nr:hypothetical protein [candidate division Zixibacteria bacterium]